MIGKIVTISRHKRIGYIKMSERVPEFPHARFIFFRAEKVLGVLFSDLHNGQQVTFEADVDGRRLFAERIKVIA